MNTKFASALVFGLVATQLVTPSFDASEVKQPVVEQAEVEVNYAPRNATKSQVIAAAPTDLVVFKDTALENAIAGALGVDAGTITVANMQSLEMLPVPGANISDLTGLEYATNLTGIELSGNNVSNLGPLSGLTKLTYLGFADNKVTDISPVVGLTNLGSFTATNNQISNITAMAGMNKLEYAMLENNKISDFSPLSAAVKSGTLEGAELTGQVIDLPAKTVATNAEVTYDIVGIDNAKHTVVLGTPVKGANTFSQETTFAVNGIINYSATVNQTVTLAGITASELVQIDEGKALTDAELIKLFNVQAANPANTTVDQGTVNYNTPDTYNIVFSNGGETVTSLLTIKNVAPKLTLTTDTVTVKVGGTIADYVKAFGAVATEFATGDLTANIKVDSSAVDFSKAGTYKVTLTVTDEEGTKVSKTGNVVVTTKDVVTPEEPTTEEGTKNPTTEEGTKTPTTEEGTSTTDTTTGNGTSTTDTTTETDSTEADSTEVTSKKSTVVMTDGSKKTLASTGNKTAMLLAVYTMVLTMAVSFKKMINSKN